MHALHTTHTHAVATKTVLLNATPHPQQSSSLPPILLNPDPWAVGPRGKEGPGPPVLSLWAIKSWMSEQREGMHHACGGGRKA